MPKTKEVIVDGIKYVPENGELQTMLTVTIFINHKPIFTRTLVNRIKDKGVYVCDDGTEIKHDPEKGAVELAIKALQTIKEIK